ncbi:MAG: AAA family ATPase, partial [Allobaculum sp.]|nr:AAA family ATPase [Allobaculum sp.]
MNEYQEQLFHALTKNREEKVKNPGFLSQIRLNQKSLEQDLAPAHFVYELLKNADEAQATSARFVLKPIRLVFAHNGHGFSISDVTKESQGYAQKGSINGLTLPEHFQKGQTTMGKFGFRSIFAYTSAPQIYDPHFCFQIDNYIVPHPLDKDHPDRKMEETLMTFLLDRIPHFDLNPSHEILTKLQSLSYPLLFLSHLKEISCQWSSGSHLYQKEILEQYSFKKISLGVKKICLTHIVNGQVKNKDVFWVFQQTYQEKGKSYPCSVAFLAGSNGSLRPLPNQPAFCFFPTQEKTGLKFLIQAPFLLSENRKKIRWNESINSNLISFLAEMTAHAIRCFKPLGEKENQSLLEDSILSVVPYDLQELSLVTGKDKVALRSFFNTIRSTFQRFPILPSTQKEYGLAKNAYWADTYQLPKLFSNEKLAFLLHDPQAFWAFPSLGANRVQSKNPELANFIQGLVKDTITEKDLLKGRTNSNYSIHDDTSISGITPSFIERQSFDWLSSFYLWLAQSPLRWKLMQNKPIFLNREGKAIAAFEDDQQILFPYSSQGHGETIHPNLLKKVGTPCLLYQFGIRPSMVKDGSFSLDTLVRLFVSLGYEESQMDWMKEDKSTAWIQEEKTIREKRKKDDFVRLPYDQISNPYSSIPTDFSWTKAKNSNQEKSLFSEQEAFDSASQSVEPKASTSVTGIQRDLGNVDDFIDYFGSQEKAVQEAQKFPKYSFGWFTRLLVAEIWSNRQSREKSKKKTESFWLRFDRVEREANTKRILILTQPKTKIPKGLKDFSRIPLILHLKETTKSIPIESAEIQEDRLRVKLQNIQDIQGIDLDDVKYVEMESKSVTFLTRALLQEMLNFKYSEAFDLQTNLCENIQFVFGPPGTGKTTYLAQKILTPLMQQQECKVLVLAPTNKAADVLTRKIMESDLNQNSYEDWLVRFGSTDDEKIENSAIFKGKSFDIQEVSKNVTVTTIARLSYDRFYTSSLEEVFLNEVKWDYVVVDEASMISLAELVYLLYKLSPKKFIVAGDPFQIEPIVKEATWKNESIYTMVHLDSFTNPKTTPYSYEIVPLNTQYRSIPEIGKIFSHFAYEGKLENYRSSNSQKPLHLENGLDIQPLNLIKFPVRSYDGLFQSRQLRNSSYQIYSALFAFEFISHLAKEISQSNLEEPFKIGIIGPYHAQMDLIGKLITTEKWPRQVKVQVGTVHGFQGDECDLILAVLNIPFKNYRTEQTHVNNRNILNVSISRARDYLFVLMPDEETEHLESFEQLTHLKQLLYQSNALQEWSAQELEEMLFKDENYLANNTFFTSHQDVNVYSVPERRYEVRVEYNAIDIQVHRVNKESIKIRKPEVFLKIINRSSSFPALASQEKSSFQEEFILEKMPTAPNPFLLGREELEEFSLKEEMTRLEEFNTLSLQDSLTQEGIEKDIQESLERQEEFLSLQDQEVEKLTEKEVEGKDSILEGLDEKSKETHEKVDELKEIVIIQAASALEKSTQEQEVSSIKVLEEEAKDKLFDSSKPDLFSSIPSKKGIAQEESIKHQKFNSLENLIVRQTNRKWEKSLNGLDSLEKEELTSQDLSLSEEEISEFLEKIPTQDFSKDESLEEKSTKFPLEECTFKSDSVLSNNFTKNKELSGIDELNSLEGSERLVEFPRVEKITPDQISSVGEESATVEKYTELGELINAMETILL